MSKTVITQVELRQGSDGSWDILEYTGACMGECVDIGPGIMHHPDCGWDYCAGATTRSAGESIIAKHYGEQGIALTIVPYKPDLTPVEISDTAFDSYPRLTGDEWVDPRSLGGEAYPDHSVADNSGNE